MNDAVGHRIPADLLREVRHMLRISGGRSLDKCVLKLDPATLTFSQVEVEREEEFKDIRGRGWRRRQKKFKDKKTKSKKKGKKHKKYHRPSARRPEVRRPATYH